MKTQTSHTLIVAVLISTLAGCQSKQRVSESSQVLARVNGDEITVHQLNAELQQLHAPVANQAAVSKKLVDGLVDRQLLVQEATKLNLDRAPEVQQLLEAARAHIYAQAYLARKTATIKPATDDEVTQFIQARPALFTQRKVFETTDLVFANNVDKFNYAQLQAQVANIDELTAWLQNNHIDYEAANGKLPSEALPAQAMTMLSQIKVGDLLFMHDDLKVVVRSVNHIVDAPLRPEQSMVMAKKMVNHNKREQFIQAELNRLRKHSKIDYVNNGLSLESVAVNSANQVPEVAGQ